MKDFLDMIESLIQKNKSLISQWLLFKLTYSTPHLLLKRLFEISQFIP